MNDTPPRKAPNFSLQKKSSARMGAVQCLYQRAVTGEKALPANLIADYKQQLGDSAAAQDKDLTPRIPPHLPTFEKIVTGVCEHQPRLQHTIEQSLKDNWKMERMSPLLLAILQAALYELLFEPNLDKAIIIDEYVTLTRGFFSEPELGFVNGFLQHQANAIRS